MLLNRTAPTTKNFPAHDVNRENLRNPTLIKYVGDGHQCQQLKKILCLPTTFIYRELEDLLSILFLLISQRRKSGLMETIGGKRSLVVI